MKPLTPDVVSIQSQVVYGTVGNTAAAHVLQANGFEVAQVPTVILSSTPHYDTLYGGPVPREWFSGWLQALFERDAVKGIRAVQIGYLGESAQADILYDWLSRVLEANNDEVLVVMDPVLGDADKGIYTGPGMTDGWRRLISLASGLTPNAFELGVLTDRPVSTMQEVFAAAGELLGGRTRWVAATSAAPATWPEGQMHTALSSGADRNVVAHEWVASAVKGTGDTFSASVTASLLKGGGLPDSMSLAGQVVTRALKDTIAAGAAELLLRNPALP